MGFNYMCQGCGKPMHLGKCGAEPVAPYKRQRSPTDDALEALGDYNPRNAFSTHRQTSGEWVVLDIQSNVAAYGFDTEAEALEWIDEQ
jgi:hypothetical protein